MLKAQWLVRIGSSPIFPVRTAALLRAAEQNHREVLPISEIEYRKEPVRGYERYSIDTDGVVYSQYGRPLKYSLNHRGYCVINFNIDCIRKGFAVHTLVARQFIPNSDPNKTQVNHKNGIKTDNRLSNLEWTSPLENVRHSREVLGFDNSGGKNGNAKAIKGAYKHTGDILQFGSLADAARFISDKFDTKYITALHGIWRAVNHYRKSYKGFIWEYIT